MSKIELNLNLESFTTPNPVTKEMKKHRNQEAENVLRYARKQLALKLPFYGKLGFSMPLILADDWCPSMATDSVSIFYCTNFVLGMDKAEKEWRLERLKHVLNDPKGESELFKKRKNYMDKWWGKKSLNEVIFLCLHEIKHVIRDHIERIGTRKPSLSNIAQDHTINTSSGDEFNWDNKDILVKNVPIIEYLCCDYKYKNWTFEAVYDDLLNNPQQQEGNGESFDLHLNSEGTPELDEESMEVLKDLGVDISAAPKISKEQLEDNKITSLGNIKAAASSTDHGDLPNDIKKIIKDLGKPQVDYVKVLTATLTSLVKEGRTYSKWNRRNTGLTRVLRGSSVLNSGQYIVNPPKDNANSLNVHIFIDTSGSVWSYLKDLMTEVVGVTQQFKQFKLHLACFDTEIHNPQSFTSEDKQNLLNYEVQGGGGTKASCIFEYLDSLQEKNETVDQVMVLSDLYFENISQYAKKYQNKTLWVVFDNDSFKPPFGKSIKYDKYRS